MNKDYGKVTQFGLLPGRKYMMRMLVKQEECGAISRASSEKELSSIMLLVRITEKQWMLAWKFLRPKYSSRRRGSSSSMSSSSVGAACFSSSPLSTRTLYTLSLLI